jgi:hypothetical protein
VRGAYASIAAPTARARPPKLTKLEPAAPVFWGRPEEAVPEAPADLVAEPAGMEGEPVPAGTVELPPTMGTLMVGTGATGVAIEGTTVM